MFPYFYFVTPTPKPTEPIIDPITVDDVLDVHDALREMAFAPSWPFRLMLTTHGLPVPEFCRAYIAAKASE